jgi:hypothetical protein
MRTNITIGEKYAPAMAITDEAEADAYFQRCVAHTLGCRPELNRDAAERIERQNLGYYAGYYDEDTRRRVERLFKTAHPVFGAIDKVGAPTPDEALQEGERMARDEKF